MKIIKNSFFTICFVLVSFLSQAQEVHQRVNYTVSVNSKIGEVTMSKEELKNAKVGVHIFNAEYKGKVILKGFTVKWPGHIAIIVSGNAMTSEAVQGIMKTKIGDYITVYDPTFIVDGKEITPSNKSVSILVK